MKYDPDQDDRLERESNYSIFNQSQNNFHQIDESQNIDDYLEELLKKQRQQYQGLLETNNAWQDFKALQQEQIKEVIPESWDEQLRDLKEMNQEKIQFSNQKPQQVDLLESSQSSAFPTPQIIHSKKYNMPQIKLAEEDLIEQYEKEQEELQRKLEIEQEQRALQIQNLKAQIKNESPIKQTSKSPSKPQPNNLICEYELEIERLYMEREDQLSKMIEEQAHQMKFIQKDQEPPMLPPYLRYSDNPIKNIPVAKTPNPNVPMNDNFVKYKITLTLPQIIDFNTIKILYSREKEEAEEEQRRQEEMRLKKEAEHRRLTELVTFSQQVTADIFSSQRPNNKSLLDQVNKMLSNKNNIVRQEQIKQEEQIDIKVSIGKGDLYESESDIYDKQLKRQFDNNKKQIQSSLQALNKLLPNIKEFEPKPFKPQKSKNNSDMRYWKISQQDFTSPLFSALELHAPEFQTLDKIEIKNEEWGSINPNLFQNYKNLTSLNLSMNKISTITGSFDCPQLLHLTLSDNLIKEITPQMFSKCDQLKTLRLDINQIKKIQHLQQLVNLEELSLSNNHIQQIEGLNTLIRLRKLNLSFNRLMRIDNLQSLALLEQLDLGKNSITNIDHLCNNTNKFYFLSELQLYSNQIQTFGKNFSFPQLRILNVNRNQDLDKFNIQMCPMLETLTCSYCSIREMGQLTSCVVLKELDISFNQIESLEQFLNITKYNSQIKQLRFNDNPFSLNKDQFFDNILFKGFPMLERVNGELIRNKSESSIYIKFSKNLFYQFNQPSLLRQYITKVMSSKIRISYFSQTYMMQYLRQQLPYLILQDITLTSPQSFHMYKHSEFLHQNHLQVEKQRKAVNLILRVYRKRKIRFSALIKRMQNHLPQIIKIQALLRGHLTRMVNHQKVLKIKRDGPKRTRKYQQISKLQANIKGFLFRQRRMKALRNLQNKKQNEDEFAEEFDVDNFFNMKEQNYDNGLSLPNEEMMQQMIQMMAISKVPTMPLPDDPNRLPAIKNTPQSHKNLGDMIKPKSMIPQMNQMLTSNNSYFYGNRPPSSGSNAISELDMNTGTNQNKIKKNTLMQSNGMDFNSSYKQTPQRLPNITGGPSQFDGTERESVYSVNSNPFYPRAQQRMAEEKKQQQIKKEEVMKEWGFQNEETMKIFEARYKKKQSKAKKQLTAAEKYQMIKEMNDRKRN